MKVLMKKTVDGAADGFTVKKYVAGSEHDLNATHGARELARVFVREGWAEQVGDSTHKLLRLPPIEEYVAAGYQAENYDRFIMAERDAAKARGHAVEVRPMNAAEMAEKSAELQRGEPPAPVVAPSTETETAPASPKAEKRKGK